MNGRCQRLIQNTLCFEHFDSLLQKVFERLFHDPDAEKVNINPSEDPDDFFLVTEISDFEYFKSLKRNVVLQSHDAFDDGSLSIYCERLERPYINIEAQDGHKSIQRSMIKEVYSHIKTK